MRIEATDSVLIIDQQTGQMLQLVPSKHQASTYKQQFEKRLDLYGMLRDFHTGSEESLGEKGNRRPQDAGIPHFAAIHAGRDADPVG